MQTNWSLILNVFLLIAVMVAIGRMIQARRKQDVILPLQPSLGPITNIPPAPDDIIAVRKISIEEQELRPQIQPKSYMNQFKRPEESQPAISPGKETDSPSFAKKIMAEVPLPEKEEWLRKKLTSEVSTNSVNSLHERVVEAEDKTEEQPAPLLLFLLAKENRHFAGYELLQTILASGLRYGDGHLFHRHQYPNGQGPVLCSLAAATATGVFDLQNIGAFSVRGLCLYMQASGNPTIDAERFAIMLDTGRQLREGLDAYLLDDRKQPLNEASLRRYQIALNLEEAVEMDAVG